MTDPALKPRLTPYLFLLPAGILLILTVFLPAAQAFLLSFARYEYDLTQLPQWVGLANFQRLWQDAIFWQTLRQTLLYLVCVVPLLVSLPLLLAILVNRKLRGIAGFRAAYYTPVIVSMVVAGLAWKYLYGETGLFNQLLAGLGLTGVPWLTSPNLALFSVMAVTIWKGLGYYMVIYLAGLQGIPAELYEAAALDRVRRLAETLGYHRSLMRPYLLLVGTISALSAMKVFEEVYVMTQGGPRNRSKTIVYYLYEQAFDRLEIGYACAIGLVLFLVVLGVSLINLKLSRR